MRTIIALRGRIAVAAVGVLLGVMGGAVHPIAALALAPRSVELAESSTLALPGAGNIQMEIDTSTRRGYVISYPSSTIEVYDVSGTSFVPIASIRGVATPADIGVDPTTSRVFVVGGASGTLSVIDGSPTSPTVNTVIDSIPTSTLPARYMAVGSKGVVFVGHQFAETVVAVDVDAHTTRQVSTGSGLNDITVDPATNTAYTANFFDKSITTIKADGTTSTAPLTDHPRYVAYANGSLLVAAEPTDGTHHIDSYDTRSWARTGRSPDLTAETSDLAVDVERRLVYVGSAEAGIPHLRALRLGSLDIEAETSTGNVDAVTVDPSTHRVLASQAARVTVFTATVEPSKGADRIGGADRYEVSAHSSTDTFAPGVPVAYLASGTVFADALSGSAAAGAGGGPVLLSGKDAVPAVVLTELNRLKPQKIVVLGGTAALSDAVVTTVSAVAPTSRIAGADRFAVSASTSAATFPSGVPVAYVASGSAFPDALSGSAAAGHDHGPVLLTGKDSVPTAILDELHRLRPATIVVLGGTSSISDAVFDVLDRMAVARRVAGTDRFDTSAAVSAAAFPKGASTVYVASGAVFPDALSGSAAAIENRGPVLLVTATSVPASVTTELDRLNPRRIVVLGGRNAISDALLSSLESYLEP